MHLWRSSVVLIFVDFQSDDLCRGDTSRTTGHRVHHAHVQQPHHVVDVIDAEVHDVDERDRARVSARCRCFRPVCVVTRRHRKHVRFNDGPVVRPGSPERAQRKRDAGPETWGHDYHAPGSSHLEPTVDDGSWVIRTVPRRTRAEQVVIVTPVCADRPEG